MTQIDFYFNAPDKWLYVSRLLRKATGQGKRIGVWCDAESIDALNQSLWQLSSTDFVSHCLANDDAQLGGLSSVVIADDWPTLCNLPKLDVHLNLKLVPPPDMRNVVRILEVVGPENDDKSSARERWKHYSQLGCQINRHDLAASSAT